MSEGADPQNTLRDYFQRHGGVNHVVIANILDNHMEFYVRPEWCDEADGMFFVIHDDGKICETGRWIP